MTKDQALYRSGSAATPIPRALLGMECRNVGQGMRIDRREIIRLGKRCQWASESAFPENSGMVGILTRVACAVERFKDR